MPKQNFIKEQQVHPNVKAKKPPQNIEAEQAVLGSAMIDETAAMNILSELRPEDFYSIAHKAVFFAMKQLFAANKPVDIVTVLEQLEIEGKSSEGGGLDYLSALTNAIPTAANHRHYTDIVKNASLRRQLIASCNDIADESYKGEKDDILSYAESKVFGIGQATERRDLSPISEAVGAAYQRMDEICRDRTSFRGVPSGFDMLDAYLNGFQKGDLIVLAARPGQGKTSLGMNFIVNAALSEVEKIPGIKSKLCCAIFSLEMPKEQIAKRMLCSVAKVSMSNASKGTLTDAEWARLRQKKPVLDAAQIYIDDTSAITPAEIVSKCRRLKREKKLDLVMIDYLQFVRYGKRTESRQQEISEIVRSIKNAARELEIPILLLCQLNRKVEERKEGRPQMSDLRESGAIEQDADVILFIYQPTDAEASKAGEASDIYKLEIGKHRNGETGVINVRWRGEYTTFENFHDDKRLNVPKTPSVATNAVVADENDLGF